MANPLLLRFSVFLKGWNIFTKIDFTCISPIFWQMESSGGKYKVVRSSAGLMFWSQDQKQQSL